MIIAGNQVEWVNGAMMPTARFDGSNTPLRATAAERAWADAELPSSAWAADRWQWLLQLMPAEMVDNASAYRQDFLQADDVEMMSKACDWNASCSMQHSAHAFSIVCIMWNRVVISDNAVGCSIECLAAAKMFHRVPCCSQADA